MRLSSMAIIELKTFLLFWDNSAFVLHKEESEIFTHDVPNLYSGEKWAAEYLQGFSVPAAQVVVRPGKPVQENAHGDCDK